MSKEPVAFEKATPQMLSADITNLVKTNTTKAQAMEKLVLTSHGLITGRFDSSLSTIEGLGARGLMSFLSSEEVQSLVDNIHAAEAVHRSLPSNDPVVVEKSKLNAAKNEAALKGYELPTANGGPAWEIFRKMETSFTDEEKNIAFSASKEALVAVANTQIPSADYAKRVQEEYVKIIKRDHPELSPEILAGLEEYASRGVAKKEGQNFSEPEKAQIREAALKTHEEFSAIFVNHKNRMQDPGQNIILEENVLSKFGRAIIYKFEEKGYMIDPKTKKEIEDLAREKVKLLDPSHIEAMSVTELVGQLEPQLLAESPRLMVLRAIREIEKEKDINVSESRAQKIVDKLAPGLAELDPEYLRQNSEVITDQIEKALIDRSMVTVNALGGLYVREGNLDTISSELLKVHTKASDLEQQQSIDNSLMYLSMGNSQLAEKLTELGVEKAKASKYDAAKISDDDFVRMRRENPEQFDRIVLKRDETAPNRQLVVDHIIDRAVYKLIENNGVKLTPEREQNLKNKFKEQLTPTLSKLDTGFLQEQSENISDNIQKKLYQNKSLGYTFGIQFSVADKSLSNISNGIIADYQKPSADFELLTVRLGMGASQANNTELEKRLNALAVEKASAVKYNADELGSEVLLKIRKEDPALFDKVVLEKEVGVVKQVVAAPVRERAQAVASATPLQPPPLLSTRDSSQSSPQKGPVTPVQAQQGATNIPLVPPVPLNYSASSSPSHPIGQDLLAPAFGEQQEQQRATPMPPPLDLSKSGKGVPAAAKRSATSSPPHSSFGPPPGDRSQRVQEVPAAAKRSATPPRSPFAPPPREDRQEVPAASPKAPQGARRSPPPPPGDRSHGAQEVPAAAKLSATPQPPRSSFGPSPRDRSQGGQNVPAASPKAPQGAKFPSPPPLPRDLSKSSKEAPAVSLKEQGAPLHPPPTPPRPRPLTAEGRNGGLERPNGR